MRNLLLFLVCCVFLSACAAKNQQTPNFPDPHTKSIGYGETETDQYIYPIEFGQLSDPARNDDPTSLKNLLNVTVPKSKDKSKKSKIAFLRRNAIRDAAHLVALQTAITWQYSKFLDATQKYASVLDTVFNFAPLMMTQGQTMIMPPIMSKCGQSLRIEDYTTATTAQVTYEILSPAEFVSAVPDWRHYLMMQNFPEPAQPNPALLPRDKKELLIWRAAIRDGWQIGIAQAAEIYKTNISRLARDYRGITLYHLLTAQNLLTKTQLAQADLGIHVNNDKMHISQKVYRITSPSRFIPASKK